MYDSITAHSTTPLRYDVDEDGSITVDELVRVFATGKEQEEGEPLFTSEELQELLKRHDMDGSNAIELEEFIDMLGAEFQAWDDKEHERLKEKQKVAEDPSDEEECEESFSSQ